MKLNLCGHEGNALGITVPRQLNVIPVGAPSPMNSGSFHIIYKRKVPLSNTNTKMWNKYFREASVEETQLISGGESV